MNGNSIENINEISDGFVNLLLKKIKPFELDFSFDKMNFLREFLSDNGYLYIRMPCISEKVNNARNLIEDFLRQNNYLDDNSVSFSEKGVLLSGYRPLTHHQTFLSLVEGKELKHFMNCLFKVEAQTLETKWIRVMGAKEYTNTHSDYYKFSNSKKELFTCWIPLSRYYFFKKILNKIAEQGLKNGTLCLCERTHQLNFDTEDCIRNYELPQDFLKHLKNKSEWVYADFKIGDLLIFNIKTIHCSFRNESDTFRINCDTRWYGL